MRKAEEILANALGVPVESATELDLGDRDQVFVEFAVAAIEQAQREAIEEAAGEAVAWGRPDMADMILELLPHREGQ